MVICNRIILDFVFISVCQFLSLFCFIVLTLLGFPLLVT